METKKITTLQDVTEWMRSKKVLVIEDTARNLRPEATKFLYSLVEHVVIAENLASAITLMPEVDVILTDLFFPSQEGGVPELNGLKVVEIARDSGKKVGVCSDFSHHQKGCHELLESLEKDFGKINGGDILFIEGRSIRSGYEEMDGSFTENEQGDWRGDDSNVVKDWGKLLVNLLIHSPASHFGDTLYFTRGQIPTK